MEATDLLTDFVARARLDPEELDRERGVVIQEITRSDDQPASVAEKLLDRAAYGDHPLGRAVLGPAEHLQLLLARGHPRLPRSSLGARQRGGAFLAGDLSRLDAAGLAELFGRFPARDDPPAPEAAPWSSSAGCSSSRARRNQSHLRLAWRPPIDPTDLAQRAALTVYSTLLGGSMGSRLFDEIREQRGLCYAIRSSSHAHADVAEPRGRLGSRLHQVPRGLRAHPRDRRRPGRRAGPRRRRSSERAPTPPARPSCRSRAAARWRAGSRPTRSPSARSSPPMTPSWRARRGDPREVRRGRRGIDGPPVVACVGPHGATDFE